MTKRNKVPKGSSMPPLSGKFDVHPDVSTMVALEALRHVWGGTLGHAVTGVLDAWAQQSLADAVALQAFVAQVHPEWAGKPLLSLPRDVFMAGIAAQDLAEATPGGHA